MNAMHDTHHRLAAAERKQQLIAEGAALRRAVVQSKQTLDAGLRPETLAKGALVRIVSTVAGFAAARSSASAATGIDLPALLPVLASAYGFLSKTRAAAPLLRIACIGGALGAAGWFIGRKLKARNADAASADGGPAGKM